MADRRARPRPSLSPASPPPGPPPRAPGRPARPRRHDPAGVTEFPRTPSPTNLRPVESEACNEGSSEMQGQVSRIPAGRRPEHLIHVRVGAEVLEDLLALLLVDHQVDAA